jgi:hypothetical protein
MKNTFLGALPVTLPWSFVHGPCLGRYHVDEIAWPTTVRELSILPQGFLLPGNVSRAIRLVSHP